MNREIKFRAWDKKEKKFHYFGFNDFCGYEEMEEVEVMQGRNCSGVYLRDGFHFSTNTNDRNGEVCPWMEITEFTGLLDKNGVEIYEGDIVSDGENKQIIRYEFGYEGDSRPYAGYIFEDGYMNTNYDFEESGKFKSLEIIGNIYQNPELLTK